MIEKYKNPLLTVDIIIEINGKIVLIQRANPPYGWALPGGFVDYGESLESSAIREAKEETGLEVTLTGLLGVYSRPDRDPRFHTLSVVYLAGGSGVLEGGDDAARARIFSPTALPEPMAFDHSEIVRDYLKFKDDGTLPMPGLIEPAPTTRATLFSSLIFLITS